MNKLSDQMFSSLPSIGLILSNIVSASNLSLTFCLYQPHMPAPPRGKVPPTIVAQSAGVAVKT